MKGYLKNLENKSYPKSGTAKRTALGSFMNTLGQIIRALEQIIFVPLFLWAWSKALYGEWIILFSIIGYVISHPQIGY